MCQISASVMLWNSKTLSSESVGLLGMENSLRCICGGLVVWLFKNQVLLAS